MPVPKPTGITITGRPRPGEHAIVLIHPLAASQSIWRDVIVGLFPRRVLTFDVPGHGSGIASETPWTMGDLADQLAGLMDAEQIERAHVVGMSLGGTAALQFALDHPGRVASIIAADCVPHYPDNVGAVLRSRAADAQRHGMAAIVDAVLGTWFTDEARVRTPEVVASARSGFIGTTATGYAMAVEALLQTDLRNQISRIDCPTLLVAGRDDLAAMRDAALSMAGDIRGARLHWLPGAHAAPVENAGEFARLLADFVVAVETG